MNEAMQMCPPKFRAECGDTFSCEWPNHDGHWSQGDKVIMSKTVHFYAVECSLSIIH